MNDGPALADWNSRAARARRIIRHGLTVLFAILAFAVLLAYPVGYLRPGLTFSARWTAGEPARRHVLRFTLDDGTLRIKHGVPIPGPNFRLASYDGWDGLSLSAVDFRAGQTGFRLRTVSVALWLVFVVFAILPGVAIVRGPVRRRWRRRHGLCAHCGYDLTGNVTGVCTECGRPV